MIPDKLRWIVTGCNGYLGGEICSALHSDGHSVVGVSRNSKNVNDLSKMGITCVSYEDLPEILKPSDCFVHCAGKTGFTGLWEEYEKVNVQWSLELFKLALSNNLYCFIYISSVAALGYLNREDLYVLNENSTPILHDQEFYGRSKLMAEKQLKNAANDADIKLVILRPGLIYGKRKINVAQSWFRRGTVVNADARVPLIHINSFVDALKRVCLTRIADGVFLVVDDEQPTQKELIQLKKELGLIKYSPWILSLTGFRTQKWVKRIFKKILRKNNLSPEPEIEPLMRFHLRQLRYDCSRLKEVTNWQPHVNLRQGWKQTIDQSSN